MDKVFFKLKFWKFVCKRIKTHKRNGPINATQHREMILNFIKPNCSTLLDFLPHLLIFSNDFKFNFKTNIFDDKDCVMVFNYWVDECLWLNKDFFEEDDVVYFINRLIEETELKPKIIYKYIRLFITGHEIGLDVKKLCSLIPKKELIRRNNLLKITGVK